MNTPDRLFVPLISEFWYAFELGEKTWEVRSLDHRFNHETVYEGRPAELRRGYSTDDSLWGRINSVREFEHAADVVRSLPIKRINPMATDEDSVITSIEELLGEDGPYIAFEVPETRPTLKEFQRA